MERDCGIGNRGERAIGGEAQLERLWRRTEKGKEVAFVTAWAQAPPCCALLRVRRHAAPAALSPQHFCRSILLSPLRAGPSTSPASPLRGASEFRPQLLPAVKPPLFPFQFSSRAFPAELRLRQLSLRDFRYRNPSPSATPALRTHPRVTPPPRPILGFTPWGAGVLLRSSSRPSST